LVGKLGWRSKEFWTAVEGNVVTWDMKRLVLVDGTGTEVHRVLVGKPEGRRLLGRPRHRWEDNIRMDIQEDGVGSE
jgi:hypothetical protein